MPRYINLLAFITLFEMMISIGLRVTIAEVAGVARRYLLVGGALIGNYLLVPAITICLLLLFRTNPIVSAGFLIIAVCPGAPYGPPLSGLAKGNVVTAVGLMFILASSSALAAPLLLKFLLPLLTGGQAGSVDSFALIRTLVLGQLLPLAIGLAIHRYFVDFAHRAKVPAARLSTVLNVCLVTILLVVQFRTLSQIRLRGYLGMVCLLLASMLAGYFMGGRNADDRKAMAITTGVRNAGVGLLIVINLLPATPAVTAATAYALIQTVAAAIIAIFWGKVSTWNRSRPMRPCAV